jgi:hypothetical protein
VIRLLLNLRPTVVGASSFRDRGCVRVCVRRACQKMMRAALAKAIDEPARSATETGAVEGNEEDEEEEEAPAASAAAGGRRRGRGSAAAAAKAAPARKKSRRR